MHRQHPSCSRKPWPARESQQSVCGCVDIDDHHHAPILKHKKPTDKLTKKKNVLDKSIEILNLKPEERTEADVDIFGKMVAVTLKPLNPY